MSSPLLRARLVVPVALILASACGSSSDPTASDATSDAGTRDGSARDASTLDGAARDDGGGGDDAASCRTGLITGPAFDLGPTGWGVSGAGTMPSLACPPVTCSAHDPTYCPDGDCFLACGLTGACVIHATPAFVQRNVIRAVTAASADVADVRFQVESSSITSSVDGLAFYLAPLGVNDPLDDRALLVAVVGVLPAGATGSFPATTAPDGVSLLEDMVVDGVARSLMVQPRLHVEAGEALPAGTLRGSLVVEGCPTAAR